MNQLSSKKVLGNKLKRANQQIEALENTIETTTRELYLSNQKILQEKESVENLLESIGASLIVVDRDRTIQHCNTETLHMLGYDRNELMGKPFSILLKENKSDKAVPTINTGQHETSYLTKNGRRIPILLSCMEINHKTESIWATSYVALDITLRKRAEKRCRVMFETAADAIMTLAPPSWGFTSGNQATLDMFHVSDERYFTSLGPADLSPEYQPDGQASSTKAQAMIETALLKGSHGFEWTYRRLDSEAFPATVLLAKFQIDGNIQLQATVHDISQRKQAEEQLQRLSKAVESANESIMITDQEGSIEYVNPAFEKITGYTKQEALNQNPRILKSGIQTAESYNKLWNTIKSGKIWSGRLSNKAKNGNTFIEDITISPIIDANGVITNFVAVKKDITEQIALETRTLQNQKLESIGQLAAGIAHEINTPIQFISDNTVFLQRAFKGLASVLAANQQMLDSIKPDGNVAQEMINQTEQAIKKAKLGFLEKQIPRAVEQSLEGLERVANIVTAMKEFSHPSQSKMQAIDLNHAVETTITVARNEWKYVAKMETDFDQTLPFIPCLRDEFNQVILNIIVNASHAISDVNHGGDDGLGVIHITTQHNDDWVEVRISDSGTGIPAEVQLKIFDPFFTTKKVGVGTGQGLAIARSVIVDKHGGTIDVQSTIGKGTTFLIRLPLSEQNAGSGSLSENRESTLGHAPGEKTA